jgi:hypothetical protein
VGVLFLILQVELEAARRLERHHLVALLVASCGGNVFAVAALYERPRPR